MPWEEKLTPFRITLIYLLLGSLALYFSDALLPQLIDDSAILIQIQALKGGVEVLLTGALIYFLAYKSQKKLRRSNEIINEQKKNLQIFNRVLRHNLRNQLSIIHGYVDLIRDTEKGKDKYLDEIKQETEELAKLSEKCQILDKLIEKKSEELEPIEVEKIIEKEVNRFEEYSDSIDTHTDFQNNKKVCSRGGLSYALESLIENSIKHNKDPQVTVSASQEGEYVKIEVEDNGKGIPEKEKEPILENEEDPLKHTSGLGLWIVKTAVEISEGELEFEDNGKGSVVIMRLKDGTEGC